MLDETTFTRLCDQNRARLLAVTARIVGADAEDVVQDAFESAWRHRASFRGQSAPSTWLHRVAVNCALMRLRSRRRGRLELIDDVEGVEGESSALPSPEDCAAARQGRHEIGQAVRALPDVDQRILGLRVWEHTCDEIAALVGISPVAVRTRLHRARHRVAHALSV